jgi:hypothetical protein
MRTFEKVSTIKSSRGDYEAVFRDDRIKWHQKLLAICGSPFAFWFMVFVLLFVFLQKFSQFHFYYIEQEHLFLYSKYYLYAEIAKPGGFVQLIADYLTQFFIVPYCGALIMSLLYASIGMLTAGIIKKIAPYSNLFVLSLIPVITILFVHFDTNYYYSGTIAYCMMLIVLYVYFCLTGLLSRIIFLLLTSVLLFWLAGPVAFLYTVCVFLWELITQFTRAYGFMVPLLLVVALSLWSVYASIVVDYRFILLPDGYFNARLHPRSVIYFSWISIFVILILSFFLRKRASLHKGRKIIEHVCLLVIIGGLSVYGIQKYVNFKSALFEELDFYLRTEQWDKIIDRSEGELKNYLYKFCLNIALAEKGELAENMFAFDQLGPKGVYLEWNRVSHISTLLSEMYFSMGHMALAQRMAFESNVSSVGGTNPRMIKRLVQTNLIYGAYPIAEKYISLLEQTKYYKNWATEQRQFLWNDEAVEQDPLLGMKRKCIIPDNRLAEMDGLDADLKRIAESNPAHEASIEYVGAIYLLTKEMDYFKELVEKYYGTDVLPTLPKSFQEAVIILSEQDPEYWSTFKIPEATIRRYSDYRKQVLANKGNQGLAGLLYRAYGDTYWFYFMFKNVN